MKNRKYLTVLIASALLSTSVFADNIYYGSQGDNYISSSIDSPDCFGLYVGRNSDNERVENVHVKVNKGVSITTQRLSTYANNTSISFLGENILSFSEGVSLYGGSSMSLNGSTLSTSTLSMSDGANMSIENSNVTLSESFYIGTSDYTSLVSIKNSNVSAGGIVDLKGSMTIDGGALSASSIYVNKGSTLNLKNMELNVSGLATKTNGISELSAVINVDNCTGNLGYVDMYGYTTSGELPVLNITNGSNVSMPLSKTETYWTFKDGELVEVTGTTNMRGGTVNVSADSTLNLTSSLVQQVDSGTQVYTSAINVQGTLTVAGDVDLNEVVVGANSSLTAENIKAENLTISEGATLALADTGSVDFANLTVVLSEQTLETGASINLSEILGENSSIVLAGLTEENSIVLTDASGNSFACEIDSENTSGDITVNVGSAVPEPSTYAMIFGAIALGFAMYRRRK